MPFDDREFPHLGGPDPDRADSWDRRRVATWLGLVAFMILIMVVLGGATRLTGSGLSIMEWAPVAGVLPPLSGAEWQRLFGLYKQIPQFELVNTGLDLAGFKRIFWLEWVHRLWGRALGTAFFVPLLWFVWRGVIGRRLGARLGALFLLGGLQGAVGWFMVASGFLPGSVAVSAYRLVAHLALAVALYAAVLMTAFSTSLPKRHHAPARGGARVLATTTAVSTFLTIVAGGFVAGLHAGLDYNTFPLMDGHLVPPGYGGTTPVVRSFFEDVATVQFDHRVFATVTAALAVATAAVGLMGRSRSRETTMAMMLLAGCVGVQYALGVATLLSLAPVDLAVAHQAGAMLLLTAALYAWHVLGLRRA